MTLDPLIIFLLCGLVTYLTRIGGHIILVRFGSIHHRLEAALDAVPTAVITSLVAPYLISHNWIESASLIIATLIALRFSMLWTVLFGLLVLLSLRHFFGII